MAGISLVACRSSVAGAFPSVPGKPTTENAAARQPRGSARADPRLFRRRRTIFLVGGGEAEFSFFWEQGNPSNGLDQDRCNVRVKDTSSAASTRVDGLWY